MNDNSFISKNNIERWKREGNWSGQHEVGEMGGGGNLPLRSIPSRVGGNLFVPITLQKQELASALT